MAERDRAAKKYKFSGGLVTLRVGIGENSEDFHIHEDVIKEQSEYFRRALNERWQEGKTRMIEFLEDETAVVAVYVEWSYSRNIAVPSPVDLQSSEIDSTLQHVLRLYVFGEKIQDDDFCDDVLGTLLRFCDKKDADGIHWFPTTKDIAMLYDGTPEGSPARKLMVHLHVRHGAENWISSDSEENHPQFLIELCKALLTRVKEFDSDNMGTVSVYQFRDKWMKKGKK